VDYVSNPDNAEAAVARIEDAEGKAVAVQADVTVHEDVEN
jgi:hypothetical protein